MSPIVNVYLLPGLFEPETLRGGVAVMIDVLRASTTIVHALAAGAVAVVACEEVEDARRIAANHTGGDCLLGGERDGVQIDRFDLDNSPLRYTPDVVGGKTIFFTTTNGTRALQRCRQAERILIGAFVNLRAIAGALADEQRPVHLVCAGTRGAITAEDVLLAGALADGLQNSDGGFQAGNDETQIAMEFYRGRVDREETSLYRALAESAGGRNLLAGGFEADIRRAAEVDLFDVVPEYDAESGMIRGRAGDR